MLNRENYAVVSIVLAFVALFGFLALGAMVASAQTLQSHYKLVTNPRDVGARKLDSGQLEVFKHRVEAVRSQRVRLSSRIPEAGFHEDRQGFNCFLVDMPGGERRLACPNGFAPGYLLQFDFINGRLHEYVGQYFPYGIDGATVLTLGRRPGEGSFFDEYDGEALLEIIFFPDSNTLPGFLYTRRQLNQWAFRQPQSDDLETIKSRRLGEAGNFYELTFFGDVPFGNYGLLIESWIGLPIRRQERNALIFAAVDAGPYVNSGNEKLVTVRGPDGRCQTRQFLFVK